MKGRKLYQIFEKKANGAQFNSFPKAIDTKVKMVQTLKRKNPTTPNPAGHFALF